jgi:hypothetical protein
VFSFLSHRDNSISLHDIILSNMTHLNLSFWSVPGRRIQLPSSMQLPALKSLHFGDVTFAANDKGIVDPFRNCHMLRTLFLNCCAVCRNTKILCISNSKLSNLRIDMFQDLNYKIVLSTPNLNSLTVWCDPLP